MDNRHFLVWQWLLACLNPEANSPEKAPDESFLLCLLDAHRLLFWFGRYLKERGISHRFSHEFLQDLSARTVRCQHIALQQLMETVRLSEGLKAQGVEVICLKGPVLSQALYAEPAYRFSVDIDLLIDPDFFEKTDTYLLSQGYVPVDRVDFQHAKRLKRYLAASKDRVYRRSKGQMGLELHWRFETRQDWFDVPFSELWQKRALVQLGSHGVFVLGDVDHFLYLCLHAAKHYFCRLQWLLDLRSFLAKKTDLDFTMLRERALVLGVEPCVSLAFVLLRDWLNWPIPAVILPGCLASDTRKRAWLIDQNRFLNDVRMCEPRLGQLSFFHSVLFRIRCARYWLSLHPHRCRTLLLMLRWGLLKLKVFSQEVF